VYLRCEENEMPNINKFNSTLNIAPDGTEVFPVDSPFDPNRVIYNNPADTGLGQDKERVDAIRRNFQGGLFNTGHRNAEGDWVTGGFQVTGDPATDGPFAGRYVTPVLPEGMWASENAGGDPNGNNGPAQNEQAPVFTNRDAMNLAYRDLLNIDHTEVAGERGGNADLIQRIMGVVGPSGLGNGIPWLPHHKDRDWGIERLDEAYDPAFLQVVQGYLSGGSPSSGQGDGMGPDTDGVGSSTGGGAETAGGG
jgi:hypothetical protein